MKKRALYLQWIAADACLKQTVLPCVLEQDTLIPALSTGSTIKTCTPITEKLLTGT